MVNRNLNLISIYHFRLVVIVILQRTICRSLQRDSRKGQKREDRSRHGGHKVGLMDNKMAVSDQRRRHKKEARVCLQMAPFPRFFPRKR